ncbi:MAG: RNA polymerase sigma factor [Gemmatimonadota bacterium]
MSVHAFAAAAPADGELVRRVLAGDRESYSTLVRRHQEALYRFVRGMRIDPDVAADLVQDGFVRGYTRLAECRDPERFRVWLFRIVRNLCLDHLKNIRRRTTPLDDVQLVDERPAPGEELERRELGQGIQAALDALTDELREAFLMKHREERSYQEMAELTGASVSAMKMRVLRAREALRDALADTVDAEA